MSEKYPTWLTGHVKEWAQKRLPTVTLCSTTGNELLEVWYYGDLLTLNEEPQLYIVPSYFAPELVTARDPESGEEFVIFDGGRHGYDNMFCEEHDPAELKNRPLKRYEIPASKLVLELGYSVDYENEKEDFEPDEADTVELVQETLDEAVCGINDLQEEFDENDSEIETVARDCIGVTVAYILEWFGIPIDIEEAIRERDW